MTAVWTETTFLEQPDKFFLELGQEFNLPPGFWDKTPGILDDETRRREIMARLTRLGYPEDGLSPEARLDEFRDEAGLLTVYKAGPETDILLKALADWEGYDQLVWPGDLTYGGRGVYVRSLQYRLYTLGFYTKKIDGVYGDFTRQAVWDFKKDMNQPRDNMDLVDLRLYRLLSDPYALNAEVFKWSKERHPLASNFSSRNQVGMEPTPRHKHLYLHNNLLEVKDYKLLSPIGYTPIASTNYLMDRGLNKVGIRLFQLWLWLTGHYQGRIDGLFYQKSFAAAREFLRDMNRAEEEDQYLVFSQDNRLLIAPAVFPLLGVETVTPEEAEQRYIYVLQTIEAGARQEAETAAREKHDKPSGFWSQVWEAVKKAVKTVYDGIKTVAVQAVKAIAEGAHFIWQKIGGLADSVKRLMFTVRDRVKGALAAFQQRLSALADFFVHREVVTVGDGHAAFTKFDADFDVINYFPRSAGELFVKEHLDKLRQTVRDFQLSCKIVAGVIWAVVSYLKGPAGWFQAAVTIVRSVMELALEEDEYAFE